MVWIKQGGKVKVFLAFSQTFISIDQNHKIGFQRIIKFYTLALPLVPHRCMHSTYSKIIQFSECIIIFDYSSWLKTFLLSTAFLLVTHIYPSDLSLHATFSTKTSEFLILAHKLSIFTLTVILTISYFNGLLLLCNLHQSNKTESFHFCNPNN